MSLRLAPGVGPPGEGREVFSVGNPTDRVTLPSRLADRFHKHTKRGSQKLRTCERAKTLSGI